MTYAKLNKNNFCFKLIPNNTEFKFIKKKKISKEKTDI